MAKLTGPTIIEAQELYTESSTGESHELGQLGVDQWGNRYRYVKAGASALVTGNLLQEPAENTDFTDMAVQAAAAIGAKSIEVTLGSTATTANLLDDGILIISVTPGIGQMFRITSHDVTAAAGTCTFNLDRPLKIALTTSSKVSVRKNPYDGVIQNPVTQTGNVVGVALYAMTAAYFGWIQSGGDCGVLFDTGTNTSDGIMGLGPSAAVAGSVKPQGGGEGATIIGFARIVASTDSRHGVAHLTID